MLPTAGSSSRKNERRTFEKTFITLIYVLPFLATAFVSVILAVSPLISKESLNGVMFGVSIAALLTVLYFAEGCEITVTRLLDRDDEQIETHPGVDMRRVRWTRSEYHNFTTGRQIIVVLCVIALTAVCTKLAHESASTLVAGKEPAWMIPIAQAKFGDIYAFLFPVLSVLVAAQIPSKWRAQRRPMRSWLNAATQLIVAISIHVGRFSGIGFVLEGAGTAEKDADPSRLGLYRALAAFRDGLGFEKIDVEIVIDPTDGSVDFVATFEMKAYGAKPSARVPQDDGWDGEIFDPLLQIVKLPNYCGTPSVIGPTFKDQTHTSVHWDLAFAAPLKPHDSCVFRVNYRTAAGTMKVEPGTEEFFGYQTVKFPANEICVKVRLLTVDSIVLREPTVEVETSPEEKESTRESERVSISESERVSRGIEPLSDGYQYRMRYPLMGARYKFSWEVGIPLRQPTTKT